MTVALLALLIAGGVSIWVFTRLQSHTGYGNNKSAVQGATVVFVVAFILVFTVGRMLLHN